MVFLGEQKNIIRFYRNPNIPHVVSIKLEHASIGFPCNPAILALHSNKLGKIILQGGAEIILDDPSYSPDTVDRCLRFIHGDGSVVVEQCKEGKLSELIDLALYWGIGSIYDSCIQFMATRNIKIKPIFKDSNKVSCDTQTYMLSETATTQTETKFYSMMGTQTGPEFVNVIGTQTYPKYPGVESSSQTNPKAACENGMQTDPTVKKVSFVLTVSDEGIVSICQGETNEKPSLFCEMKPTDLDTTKQSATMESNHTDSSDSGINVPKQCNCDLKVSVIEIPPETPESASTASVTEASNFKEESSSEESSSEDSSSEGDSSDETEDKTPRPKPAKCPAESGASKKDVKDSDNSSSDKSESLELEIISASIFVAGLSWDITNEGLQKAFSGSTGARVAIDRETGRSKGFGCIDFLDVASATKAMKAMQWAPLDGRNVNKEDFEAESSSEEYSREESNDETPVPVQGSEPVSIIPNHRNWGGDWGQGERGRVARIPNPPSTTIFAKSLSWDTTNESLQEAFIGSTGARVVIDRVTGRSKGFGFIDFSDVASADKAMKAMQGAQVDYRNVILDFDMTRSDHRGRDGRGGRGGWGSSSIDFTLTRGRVTLENNPSESSDSGIMVPKKDNCDNSTVVEIPPVTFDKSPATSVASTTEKSNSEEESSSEESSFEESSLEEESSSEGSDPVSSISDDIVINETPSATPTAATIIASKTVGNIRSLDKVQNQIEVVDVICTPYACKLINDLHLKEDLTDLMIDASKNNMGFTQPLKLYSALDLIAHASSKIRFKIAPEIKRVFSPFLLVENITKIPTSLLADIKLTLPKNLRACMTYTALKCLKDVKVQTFSGFNIQAVSILIATFQKSGKIFLIKRKKKGAELCEISGCEIEDHRILHVTFHRVNDSPETVFYTPQGELDIHSNNIIHCYLMGFDNDTKSHHYISLLQASTSNIVERLRNLSSYSIKVIYSLKHSVRDKVLRDIVIHRNQHTG